MIFQGLLELSDSIVDLNMSVLKLFDRNWIILLGLFEIKL